MLHAECSMQGRGDRYLYGVARGCLVLWLSSGIFLSSNTFANKQSILLEDDLLLSSQVIPLPVVPREISTASSAGKIRNFQTMAEPRCGNRFVEGVEQCDDGNVMNSDGCSSECRMEIIKTTTSQCTTDRDCDDDNACNGEERCSNGTCSAGTALTCSDDGNACTTEVCNPTSGCVSEQNSKPCNDFNACTVEDRCAGGTCGSTAMQCPSGHACQEGECICTEPKVTISGGGSGSVGSSLSFSVTTTCGGSSGEAEAEAWQETSWLSQFFGVPSAFAEPGPNAVAGKSDSTDKKKGKKVRKANSDFVANSNLQNSPSMGTPQEGLENLGQARLEMMIKNLGDVLSISGLANMGFMLEGEEQTLLFFEAEEDMRNENMAQTNIIFQNIPFLQSAEFGPEDEEEGNEAIEGGANKVLAVENTSKGKKRAVVQLGSGKDAQPTDSDQGSVGGTRPPPSPAPSVQVSVTYSDNLAMDSSSGQSLSFKCVKPGMGTVTISLSTGASSSTEINCACPADKPNYNPVQNECMSCPSDKPFLDAATKTCRACTNDSHCKDANPCTKNEACDSSTGQCKAEVIPNCSCSANSECVDGDPCTKDVCSTDKACLHTAVSGCPKTCEDAGFYSNASSLVCPQDKAVTFTNSDTGERRALSCFVESGCPTGFSSSSSSCDKCVETKSMSCAGGKNLTCYQCADAQWKTSKDQVCVNAGYAGEKSGTCPGVASGNSDEFGNQCQSSVTREMTCTAPAIPKPGLSDPVATEKVDCCKCSSGFSSGSCTATSCTEPRGEVEICTACVASCSTCSSQAVQRTCTQTGGNWSGRGCLNSVA